MLNKVKWEFIIFFKKNQTQNESAFFSAVFLSSVNDINIYLVAYAKMPKKKKKEE